MGKVFKYIGWAFLGIIILIAGTIGVLFATGAFKDESIYLETINFDSDSLLNNLDENNTAISEINDVLVANDNFNMKINFSPENATTKNLTLTVLKGQEAVVVPKTVVAGEEFTVEIVKTKQVTFGSLTYYIIENKLYDNNYALVTNLEYEIFDEIGVIKIGDNYYKIKEFNVGGEVRIKAVDSEGGTTWSQFEFFVDSSITDIGLDFSAVPGELENNTIVFNENDLTFTLTTMPTYAINPSTGEIYTDKFSFKNVITESSNEEVIKITKTENLERRDGDDDLLRSIRYTFKTLQAGTSTITSKTLPTYQMYLDYVEADTIFKTDVSQGFMAVTNFANKYLDYIKQCGEIVVDNETNTVSTTGYNWYKEKSTQDGRLVINREADYYALMDLMFITASQDIVVENVEITDFRVGNTVVNLNLFESLNYNGQELTRENLTKLFNIKLTSTSSNISDSALNVRLNDLQLYSIKQGDIFDSVEAIQGEDLLTIKEYENGQLVDKIVYSPILVEGVTKYLTYKSNNTVLEVKNPSSQDSTKVWKITANKEQEREDDGTGILFVLYDEISGTYFKQIANVNIKINQINVFSLNQNLITDMSINSTNNNGYPNVQYVDLSLDKIGTSGSLIKEFTMDASYTNIKLFVSEATAKINGYLKVRVKTVDGTLNGEPMVYTLPYGGNTINVYEINYTNDSSGRICIEALNTSVVYTMDEANPTNPTSEYTLNDIELYVAVVRTNVLGEPIDADGNLVDEKYDEEGTGNWQYRNVYDIIKVASETIKFNIYSFLQDLQYYTANEDGTSDFQNRTTVDGVIKTPVKMVVGQRFEMFVTNLNLDNTGTFNGSDNERTNLNTALFDFWFNNLNVNGQNKNAFFSTSNESAVQIHETLSMVNGMIKITIECFDATTSADIFLAVNDDEFSFLEGCRANIQISFATIQENTVKAYYSAGGSSNQAISNDQTLSIKGSLNNGKLVWQYYEGGESKGEFKFGGSDGNKSLDYNLNLNLDTAYVGNEETISEDIKNNAIYEWVSSEPSYVSVTEKAGANGYDPILTILKGSPEGINVVITCTIYLYEDAVGSNDVKYNGTKFTFRFVLNIVQSEVVVTGYSINNESGVDLWQINDSTQTSQKINGGSSFDILAEHSARDTIDGVIQTRTPISATIDNVDIRDSLIFTIETYHSADSQNSDKNAIYFLVDGKPTYQVSGLKATGGEYSLIVYAKDSLTDIDAAIRISTFNSASADYVYYITVKANLEITTDLPEGKNYIETTLGANNTIYTFNETNKSLDDYYKLKKNGANLTLIYEVTSNNSYGSIGASNVFIPSRVSPTKTYENVGVTIKYNISVQGTTETYTYNTITVRVLPYYNNIQFNTNTFNIKAGLTYNLFTDGQYDENEPDNVGVKLFNVTSNYSSEIDDLSTILRIQIADTESESKLKTIFGEEKYNELLQNNLFFTNGEIKTSEALTTDETIRIKVYFVEYGTKTVELTNTSENLIYLKVNKTVKYETDYNTEENAFEVQKQYTITPNMSGSNKYIEVSYNDSITNVYGSEAVDNLVSLIGGNNTDVFYSIIKNVVLQKKTNQVYSVYTGDSVELITNYELGANRTNLYNLVQLNYKNSVNEVEYYKIVFISISNEMYEFYFKLMPDITITTTYPVLDSYENANNNTTIDLQENFISKNRRVELSYNGVVLNANLKDTNSIDKTITLSVDKQKLIESGLVEEDQLTAFTDSTIDFVINNANAMFTYSVYSGQVNVDSGVLQGSEITFNIQDYNTINTVVKIETFNGATAYYTFAVRHNLERYVVSVDGNVEVYANNEFSLRQFINSCKLPSALTSNFNALRILVQDFNGLTLKSKNTDGLYTTINPYELIGYDSTLKFNDVGVSKTVVFYLYTITSVYGDTITKLTLTVKPNVIISPNQTYIPAGVEIDIANTELSPFTIIYGDSAETPITSGITYTLVDENGDPFTYNDVTLSNGKIKHNNVETDKIVYVLVDVELDGCSYQEVLKITFKPNVKIVFDYETSSAPTIYRTQISAPIKVNDGITNNRETLYLWDDKTNSSSYPIYITDYYGNNIDFTSGTTILFSIEEDESNIVNALNPNTGALVYLPTNKVNTMVKVKVLITWQNGASYSRIYNIAFQPNISANNGVTINYQTSVGDSTNSKQKLSIYGGSSVEFKAFNTMEGTILEQSYKASDSEPLTTNSMSIDVLNSAGEKTIAYLLFEECETDYYTITSSGIKFKAVSETTEVRIPYYLNLRYIKDEGNIKYCGVFADNLIDGKYAHEYYYTPGTNGEIVVELLSVISSVTSSYNSDNPYSVIVRNNNDNVVNLYTLLNVTLVQNATFDGGDSTKVLIDKEDLSKLFTISVANNYATLYGQTIVFNIHSSVVSKFEIKFTIGGVSEIVSAFVSFNNNAILSPIDAVKTFTYNNNEYYVINNIVYDYKKVKVGEVDGEDVKIAGSVVASFDSLIDLTLSDNTKVLNIYNSNDGKIDLTELVNYIVQNNYIMIGASKYYIQSTSTGTNKLVNASGEEYSGNYVISSEYVEITESTSLDIKTEDSNKYVDTNLGKYYIISIPDGDGTTYILQSQLTGGVEYNGSYNVNMEANKVLITSTNYVINVESVELVKNGLTFSISSVGENDKYVQNGSNLTLIPFYSTNIGLDRTPFTFIVNSNNNLQTNITFYVLPVETSWEILYNDEETFNVEEPTQDNDTIGIVELSAKYGTEDGQIQATDYTFRLQNTTNFAVIEKDEQSNKYILKIDYSKFSYSQEIIIDVQATFNDNIVSNTYNVTVTPKINFVANNVSLTLDPELTSEQSVQINNASNSLITADSSGEIVIELANVEDNEYVTIESDKVVIENSLYLLETKEIIFNVSYTNEINGVECVFNSNSVLKLEQNTKLLNLFNSKEINITSDSGSTQINADAPIKVVNASDESKEYSNLTIQVEVISYACGPDQFSGLVVTATISNGVITLTYGDVNGQYPNYVNAILKLTVKNGEDIIYTSSEISCTLTK